MNNSLLNLPEDVLINNILLSSKPKVLLPNKSLLSLRCICKYLRNLITSPAFIKMHLHHSATATSPSPDHQLSNQLVLIHTSNDGFFYSLKFNDGDPCHPEVVKFVSPIKSLRIWGSCNGLLCLTDINDKVCLLNPFTKEYKDLPPYLPLTEFFIPNYRGHGTIIYGIGYDRLIDDYKIIRCQNVEGQLEEDGTDHDDGGCISMIEYQVYTLGTNTWRKISADNNPYKSYFVVTHYTPTMFVNGALHWIMSTTSIWTDVKIVSFDIEKEVFQEIQMPLIHGKGDHMFIGTIQVLRGCLSLFEFYHSENYADKLNVWMMMDYGVSESWTKLFTIDTIILVLRTSYSYNTVPASRFLRFCENGEILIGSCNILFAYDPINNKTRSVDEFGDIGKYVSQSGIYIESLVSLNTKVFTRGERRIHPRTKKKV